MQLVQGSHLDWHWSGPLRTMVLMLVRLGLPLQFSKLLFGTHLPKVLMAPLDLVCGITFLCDSVVRP